jgi:hypothetical protein
MPSTSKAQQRFFSMIRAVQEGKYKNPSKDLQEKANSISKQDAHDFATTTVKNAPEKVSKVAFYTKHQENTSQTNNYTLELSNNHMSNPFAEFEKTASDLGFSAQDIEQMKKEACENFNPEQKEKQAQEESFSNYVEGFVKSAMEHGVSFNEAKELLDIANTVKTAEELNTSIKTHFTKNHETQQKTASVKGVEYGVGFVKAANDKGIGTDVAVNMLKVANPGFDINALIEQLGQTAQENPKTTGAIGGGLAGAGIGGLIGGGKGAAIGAGTGALTGLGGGKLYDMGGDQKNEDLRKIQSNMQAIRDAAQMKADEHSSIMNDIHAAETGKLTDANTGELTRGLQDENNFHALARRLGLIDNKLPRGAQQ